MVKKSIIVEIDNVLADTSARNHLLDVGWSDYHAALGTDTPNEPVVETLRAMSEAGHEVLIVTGRPARYDLETFKWLTKHDIPSDEILARSDSDYRSEIEVKLDLIDDYFGSREVALQSVLVAFDQKEKVVEEFRNAGFTTWQMR